MTNFIRGICLFLFVLFNTACQYQTDFGPCVGMFEQDKKQDILVYEPSTRNVIIGVLTLQTLLVPAYVFLRTFECPVGLKSTK